MLSSRRPGVASAHVGASSAGGAQCPGSREGRRGQGGSCADCGGGGNGGEGSEAAGAQFYWEGLSVGRGPG